MDHAQFLQPKTKLHIISLVLGTKGSTHGSQENLEYGFGPLSPYFCLISWCLCFISALLSSCLVFVFLACFCILASNRPDPKFSHLQQQNMQTNRAIMRTAPSTDRVIISVWKFIQQSPQRASSSGQREWGGRIVRTGYVTHDFVLMHHKHVTFLRHSSQLVPFFFSHTCSGVDSARTVAKPETSRRAGRKIPKLFIIQPLRRRGLSTLLVFFYFFFVQGLYFKKHASCTGARKKKQICLLLVDRRNSKSEVCREGNTKIGRAHV